MIRAASAADARALGELHNRTWWRAYQDVIDPQALMDRVEVDRTEEWAARIADDDTDVLVYDLGGEIHALASVCPSRIEPGPGELAALYVAPPAQGAGVGSDLLERGMGLLHGRGYTEAVLWVFRDNGHGRHFYERRGWTLEEGSEALNPPSWVAPAVRYRRPLP